MKDLIRSVIQAFFLNEVAYTEIREEPNPALRGLGIVVLISVVVAFAGLVGTILEWATTPNMGEVQATVLDNLKEMPWYQELEPNPEFRSNFSQWYEMGWRIFPTLFGAPNIPSAEAMIFLLPFGLTIMWFLYGLVAHLFARMMGGQGSLWQTLGCTALAIAPQLLNIVTFLPYLVVGGVVGTWTLLCRYIALKTCHGMTWGRTLVTTLVPYVAFALMMMLFGCLGSMILGLILGGGVSR